MNKIIRIGTRSSELAVWQATTVKKQLVSLGYKAELVPIKSTGDLILDKPLHELGITGVFTKALDVAMLNGEIDIAVHSMKDVPTALPQGIVQAAVLERANFFDLLVYKKNEEFLAQPGAVIATGSLRRRAQWLNRYPSHNIVDLRGNVNSRLEKLETNEDWNGAIFAAAGLNRLEINPENTIGLTWMLPAPAQGVIMVVAKEEDDDIREACAYLNHEPTEICTTLEREFLNKLEGGCTAPIGALATIKDDKVTLKGCLLSIDGTKKLDAEFETPLGKHHSLGKDCANSILSRGGKKLMGDLQKEELNKAAAVQLVSTKKLTPAQEALVDNTVNIISEDFIKTNPNRIPSKSLTGKYKNVIITSQNAVDALLMNTDAASLNFDTIYCVGRKTKRLIESRIGPVKYVASNAKKLADHLVEYMEGISVTYFCSNLRLDDLPKTLRDNNLEVNEVEVYETKQTPLEVDDTINGVLFYSPSTVTSYLSKNKPFGIAFCIGDTTANEAKKYFKEVKVAKIPSVEHVLALVQETYK